MNDFGVVLSIAAVAAILTYLGAPLAERYAVPQPLLSGALQFAAGTITAIVALTLMPPAVRCSWPSSTTRRAGSQIRRRQTRT